MAAAAGNHNRRWGRPLAASAAPSDCLHCVPVIRPRPRASFRFMRYHTLALATALLLHTPRLLAPQTPAAFTLGDVLSAPFPSELSAAPKGGAVAWVLDERGARNVWVAEAPAYRGRRLTSFTADDGQEITPLVWSPDGRTLVYVRGGGANRAGENPNPTSDPSGAEEALWRVSVGGGPPVRIGIGSEPVVSPRGDVLAFTRRGQIYTASLLNTAEPAQLVHARGGASNLRWSPDGSKLAFTSGRGDHSFVAVYDVARKALHFIAPTVDEDGSPVWSPDGSRIAFIRIPASTTLDLFTPVRAAQPWSWPDQHPATRVARQQ